MNINPFKTILPFLVLFLVYSCGENKPKNKTDESTTVLTAKAYTGTASITQGIATNLLEDIYECDRGRKTDVGEITSTDGKKWTVPAETNYTNENFPFAIDLYNACEGKNYNTAQEAMSHYNDLDIVEIDNDGEVFTA
ncbi:MAG: hypothetical protein ABJO28_06680, partial [Maribacter dokdonensis]|uniref:hypothetical protein n=1 Tax=Maribacter dokdonensis TaxID=320912 RepID=UPI00329C3B2B